MGAKASVNLILHAHSPYVRHLEYPKFLEENWLFESLCESYIPLLRMLMDLRNVSSGIRLSPTERGSAPTREGPATPRPMRTRSSSGPSSCPHSRFCASTPLSRNILKRA